MATGNVATEGLGQMDRMKSCRYATEERHMELYWHTEQPYLPPPGGWRTILSSGWFILDMPSIFHLQVDIGLTCANATLNPCDETRRKRNHIMKVSAPFYLQRRHLKPLFSVPGNAFVE